MDETQRVTPDEFVALVDEHVTPPMQRLGYHRIHLEQTAFDVGYEADSEEVMARLLPGDSFSAEEIWVHYDPRSDRLEFSGAEPILTTSAHAAFHQPMLNTPQPINLRIRSLGAAIAAFDRPDPNTT